MRTHSTYVQQCAPRIFNSKKHWYYYCNCSGVYRNTSKGVRHTKSQGTSKTGERCIANMKVIEDNSTGEVDVQYCSTHHNHEVSIGVVWMQYDTHKGTSYYF